ncbi:DUF615 domain-containing protein [Aliikangiella maris]|uniref:DUF615 domain-containing protein n=2 Tax=Aliikangiella maris TaxID=3162458 RepID=A0ABV3MMS2_9GAMM
MANFNDNFDDSSEESFDEISEQSSAQAEETFVSKTQLKNEAKALVTFGQRLTTLPESTLRKLPLGEVTLKAVIEFHKQKGHIARKRHLGFIGKCLRNEVVDDIKACLDGDKFSQLRQNAINQSGSHQKATDEGSIKSESQSEDSAETVVASLLENGDQAVETLLQAFAGLNRQLLRQLLRNIKNAKSATKKQAAQVKLTHYLQENKVI